jgi:hypothetical protein
MSDLTQAVMSHLDQAHIDAIAAQLGVDPAQAESAIQQAMPLLVGGIARQASNDPGAVHSMLGQHAGNDIGSMLGGLLGGAGGGGLPAILGNVFGGRQDQAAQGLGQASGIGTGNANQLLGMLAPIVMSVLGSMGQRQGLDPGALGSVLGAEHQRIAQGNAGGLLGSVFDQDGDGRFGVSDVLKIGEGLLGGRGRPV